MPDDIYWRDSLAWSEQQADLLECLASGERVKAQIDWENVVEEVLSVGRAQMQSVERLLTRALEHIMKIHGWPRSLSVNHWKIEALTFLLDAERPLSPFMRNRIDLAHIYRRAALPIVKFRIDRSAPVPIPAVCPVDGLGDRRVDEVHQTGAPVGTNSVDFVHPTTPLFCFWSFAHGR